MPSNFSSSAIDLALDDSNAVGDSLIQFFDKFGQFLAAVSLMFDEPIYQLMTASNLPHSVVFDFGRTA